MRRLEWGSTEDLALFEPPYDVVIAGDCLYEESCIAPLLQTMWALAGPETEVSFFLLSERTPPFVGCSLRGLTPVTLKGRRDGHGEGTVGPFERRSRRPRSVQDFCVPGDTWE